MRIRRRRRRRRCRPYVSRLRRAFEASGDGTALVTRARGYELRLAPDDVDAQRFERLIARGAPREALAPVARPGARGRRGRTVRGRGDPPARGAAARGDRAGDRRRLAAGRHVELVAELEVAGRGAAAPRAPAGAADARAVPLRPAGRGAAGAIRDARAMLVDQIGVGTGSRAATARTRRSCFRTRRWPGMPACAPPVVMCPFKGLAAYDVEDAAVFFGRERLISEVVARLAGGASLLGCGRPVRQREVLRAACRPACVARARRAAGQRALADRRCCAPALVRSPALEAGERRSVAKRSSWLSTSSRRSSPPAATSESAPISSTRSSTRAIR